MLLSFGDAGGCPCPANLQPLAPLRRGFFVGVPPPSLATVQTRHKFDPETIRVMGLAFEMALVALQLADRGDLANEIIAQKIMELAKAGERDTERLCEGVLQEFRRPPQV